LKRIFILLLFLIPLNFFFWKESKPDCFEFTPFFSAENLIVSFPTYLEEENDYEYSTEEEATIAEEKGIGSNDVILAASPQTLITPKTPAGSALQTGLASSIAVTLPDSEPELSREEGATSGKELVYHYSWPNQKKVTPQLPRRKAYNWLPKRITVEHIQGNQNEIAFGTNYTTVGLLFSPPYHIGRILPMADFRGHRFDDCTYAFNVGAIARYIPYPDTFCRLLGFNAYYDYRQGGVGYYQQAGFGLEILGRRWDFRGNAYIPFAGKKNVKVCVYDDYEGDYVITNSFLEEVSYSFNAEIGYLALRSKYLLFYMAGGPYYISGRKCFNNTVGGKARVRPQYKDYLALDLSISYDPLFKTIYQAEIILSLPLYQIGNQNKNPCGISDRQIYQPVERFEVMPLMRQSCWTSNF